MHVLYDYHESVIFPSKYVWKRLVNTHVEKSFYTNWYYRVSNDDELSHILKRNKYQNSGILGKTIRKPEKVAKQSSSEKFLTLHIIRHRP